jgi:hypothetical protein
MNFLNIDSMLIQMLRWKYASTSNHTYRSRAFQITNLGKKSVAKKERLLQSGETYQHPMQNQKSSKSTSEITYGSEKWLLRYFEHISNTKKSSPWSKSVREPFTTIDDLVNKARELFSGLAELSERTYPLDIRRGIRKGVKRMAAKKDHSKTVKAGSKTYFFDIKETKEGKPFLVITESRFKSEGKERERSSIVVFQEKAGEFARAVSAMTKKLG